MIPEMDATIVMWLKANTTSRGAENRSDLDDKRLKSIFSSLPPAADQIWSVEKICEQCNNLSESFVPKLVLSFVQS